MDAPRSTVAQPVMPATASNSPAPPAMVAGAAGAPAQMPATGASEDTAGATDDAMTATDPAPAEWTWTPTGLPDVSVSMSISIPAGQEMFRCLYFAMPTDRGVIAVPAMESHMAAGSHHLVTRRTSLTSIPAGQDQQFDCYASGSAIVFNEAGSIYEAQQPDSHRALPSGVAQEFQPGEVLLIIAHYVNVTDAAIEGQVQLILHTMDLADVQQEAGTIMFDNTNISLPPGQKTRVSMTCTLPADFHPALLWSHMHHWGTHFIATTDDAEAAATLGTLYDQTDWDEPQPREYPNDPPVTIHAGNHITFSCDYMNDQTTTITFGASAETNEMCLLHGMYWPRMQNAGAEQCRGGTTTIEAIP